MAKLSANSDIHCSGGKLRK